MLALAPGWRAPRHDSDLRHCSRGLMWQAEVDMRASMEGYTAVAGQVSRMASLECRAFQESSARWHELIFSKKSELQAIKHNHVLQGKQLLKPACLPKPAWCHPSFKPAVTRPQSSGGGQCRCSRAGIGLIDRGPRKGSLENWVRYMAMHSSFTHKRCSPRAVDAHLQRGLHPHPHRQPLPPFASRCLPRPPA